MQKSSYPEGTVFICVGAVLGFLGFCVLAWRGMVAYAINRSVKRAALASIMASDAKAPAWLANGVVGAGFATKKGPGGKMYRQPTDASSLSLEALTANGKKADPYSTHRASAIPTRKEQKRDPSSLFFSPTAGGLGGPGAPPMAGLNSNTGNRSSTYLPAGYYAAPSAQQQSEHSRNYSRTTPPESPSRRPASSHLRAPSGQQPKIRGLASLATNPQNRNSAPLLSPSYLGGGSGGGTSGLYHQASNSSLHVGFGTGEEELQTPGSRAPSAYFDDVLENHGHGPRERY